MNILNLDCRLGLAMLPDNSVDAILTDPPYELGFMGNAWDKSGIAFDVNVWKEALRVLKPGGHLLAFSGSRTYHKIASAIEGGGFEIRDSIMWVYGSGFPKSLDISKALDKLYGFGDVDAPATIAAQIWDGWGTGLKPAHEPICVARKPMAAATVAGNVVEWGVGGINIEGCRVPINPIVDASQLRTMSVSQHDGADGWGMNTSNANPAARVLGQEGRWPSNLIHDGSPEVLATFPSAPGQQGRAKNDGTVSENNVYGEMRNVTTHPEPRGDSGSAARFFKTCEWAQDDLESNLLFYVAKASKREKGRDNTHPTVKPITLGRYLSRLVCPPGGTILDLFAGSGSFGVAAMQEGFGFVGFELDPVHCENANVRLMNATLPANLNT